ncbi:UvrD-helicase domain-containing protein [Cardiobacterium hominis]|uniref:UvrD-helicase domain-containing protein n=1 Tax=Cardiobacterium hominis TaxID=2718 RepID=UPI0028D52E53|nr:UvrD-helicase domain-containing protein [Cardiobacterium hominis]
MNTTTEPTPALEIPLEGRALIEASAGTGKTWTLTGIILRLLIEGGYPPREIIATTFTRKAAAEMQQRVHKRLHALRENLKAIAAHYLAEETVLNDDDGLATRLDDIIGGSGGDLINRHLILNAVAKHGLDGLIAIFSRVESLQARLDELFIGTIDSLCQRWLAEFALETGNDERLQINENSPALEETIHDTLRRLLHENHQHDPETFAQMLADGAYHDSDAYLAAAREATSHRHAAIDSGDVSADYDRDRHQALMRQLRGLDAAVIADWQALTREPAFTAATNGRYSWHKNLDALPALIAQLKEDRTLTGDSTKLAPGFTAPNFKNGHDALAARFTAHPFTLLIRELLAARDARQNHLDHHKRQTIASLLETVRQTYPQALEARGETTFSEKTARINEALAHPQHGTNLAHYLTRRYPVMLVDESQDLNDEQAALLERTYLREDSERKHGFLLLVGDPKQAIYGFRGGDVANYNRLKTRFRPDEQHRLDTNRRSSPNLIAALNEHYLQDDNARLGADITYHEARAANPAQTILAADGSPIARPMQWTNSGTNQDSETDTIAALVARLTDGTGIAPRDIQILMRSNSSLETLQNKLHAQHIDSERSHDRSIFTGAVARTFADLLAALEQPEHRDRQNRLLSGLYYGHSQQDLDRLAAIEQGEIPARADELTLAELREALTQAHDAWQSWGLLAALNPLLTHEKHNIWQTLAACPAPDNLRHLLDLRHIQTILAEHAPKQRPAQFGAWWRAQLAAPPDADWAKAPPLPGQNAVHLLTIHKAKGLEAPVVILATGSNHKGGGANPVPTWRYRDGDTIRISLAKPANTPIDQQENEEQRRLLYVGLTRAKNLLLVAHRECKPDKANPTPTEKLYLTYAQNPGRCPHAGETSAEALAARPYRAHSSHEPPANPPPQQSRGGEGGNGGSACDFTAYAHEKPLSLWERGWGEGGEKAASAGRISAQRVTQQPDDHQTAATESPTNPPPLQSGGGQGRGCENPRSTAPVWRTRFQGWQRSSFSALLRDALEPTSPDLADYAIAAPQNAPDAPPDADIRYTYPRGTAPGSALHAVLERIRPDNRADWRRYLEHDNRQWQLGLEPAQLDACENWLEAIQHCELPQSRISLGASKQGTHRSEYGFTLGSDARAVLDIPAINAHFAAHGHPLHLSDKHRHIRYLRGEIDHLYQHDGRYYILDYKTNHLGNSPADYTPENIRTAMGDHHYWLQAALYQVALHRLLQTRLADYDPARHLGGIEYLYLRGIDPAHPANGKYGWNYPPEFIAGLDRILGHEAA